MTSPKPSPDNEELIRSPKRISIAGPWITQREIDYVTDAVTNAWYENANAYHERFERALRDFYSVRHALLLPSCTSALHLALLAYDIGPGDEVIVPDLTWIATAAPISYVGATPVFADADPKTWCLSPEAFESCITPNVKAVIPVDLYGNMPDYDVIREIADRHHIIVIEDAAESIGAEYKNRPAGSLGECGTFSFHGSKTMTTGEGGALLTNDDKIGERAQFLRDHGRKPGDRMFFNAEVAYKYKMSGLQAALGLAQFERIDELVEKKRRIYEWYEARLADKEGITLNYEPPHVKNSFWMVTVLLDPGYGVLKSDLMERLYRYNIDTRPFFHPLSSLPAYESTEQARIARERNRISYRLHPYGINLPSSLNLQEEDVDFVCRALMTVIHRD